MTTFDTEAAGDAVVVRIGGRLDLVSAGDLRTLVDGEIADGHRRVVVDLGGVELLDSSGLGALIGSLKTARQAGGDLRIACVREQARLVLELTTMDRVLRPYATVEEALG